MAVEIRELVIKAVIDDKATSAGGGDNKEEIISACVEEVLRIMERKQQR